MPRYEPKLLIPSAHNGQIHALAYNSSGSYLFSGGSDRVIHLWNSKTGNKIHTYKAHGYEVLDINIVNDDTKFVSCGGDRSVYLWDVQSCNTIARLAGHTSKVHTVSFHSPQGSVLASGGFDKLVNIWDVRALNGNGNGGKPIQVLDDAKDGISSVQMLEHEIITGSADGLVRIYDARMGKLSSLVMGSPVTSIRKLVGSSLTTQTNQSVLVSTLDSKIRLMNQLDGTLVKEYSDADYCNKELRIKSRFVARGSMIASVSESSGQMFLWNGKTAAVDHRVANCTSYSYAVDPYSMFIATAASNGHIQIHSQ